MIPRTKFAALTAGLLARKGEAHPATAVAATEDLEPLDHGFVRHPAAPVVRPRLAAVGEDRARVTSVADIQRSIEAALTGGEIDEAPRAPAATPPAPAATGETPRERCEACPGDSDDDRKFHVSVRLKRGRYLRLKLAAASLHRPSQDIIGEALDRYFADLGKDVLGDCPCLGK
ncbi:MAG: hypothetical protein GC199_06745 [Alphaproteobacteria bacterium]|nr:hypothetical protein [Alphaproteobacteria bacterium]